MNSPVFAQTVQYFTSGGQDFTPPPDGTPVQIS